MNRRHLLVSLAAGPTLAMLIAACGDPDSVPGDASPSSVSPTTAPPATAAPSTTAAPPTGVAGAASIEHPTGADDVVVRIGYEGGFVPQGVAFQHVPTLLVTGDGRVFQQGAQPMIYPGPLLPALTVATVPDAVLQRLLAAADEHGLLTDPVPAYDADSGIADAPNTVVELHARGGTFAHSAYALGMHQDPSGTPMDEVSVARRNLLAFVTAAEGIVGQGAPAMVEAQVFAPSEYRVQARPVTLDEFAGQEIAPTVAPWPADTGLRLADAAACAIGSGAALTTALGGANSLSLFTEDGTSYQLTAVAKLPGDTC